METELTKVLAELTKLKKEFHQANEQNERAALYTKEVLTIEEAAVYSGYSRRTLLNFCQDHNLSHYRRGAHFYFKRSEFEAWLTGCKVLSDDEIESVNSKHTLTRIKSV